MELTVEPSSEPAPGEPDLSATRDEVDGATSFEAGNAAKVSDASADPSPENRSRMNVNTLGQEIGKPGEKEINA